STARSGCVQWGRRPRLRRTARSGSGMTPGTGVAGALWAQRNEVDAAQGPPLIRRHAYIK
ncbi:MAG: hypothetical protein ACLQBJ_18470, partial [Bryobacteraceae bacterium]